MSVRADVGAVAIGRNEGARLQACLRSLVGRVACLVYVDSGSTDGSVELAASLGAEVVRLDLSRPFTAARARNEGLRRLREAAPDVRYVQFVDGDCEVRDGWIDAAVRTLREDKSLAVVCGRRRERHPEATVYNLLCDMEWDTPVGIANSCGGDAMMLADAVEQVGGYDGRVIAGEEPELCFRLRQRGWRVRRIDEEMTLHDAAMTRFGQWWRRAERAGHACAEGVWMHGRARERFNVRRLARIVGWGGVLPVASLLLAAALSPLWLAAPVAAYGVQFWRIRSYQAWRGRDRRTGTLYALFTVLDKLPSLLGACRFGVRRLTGRTSTIIEYKGGGEAPTRIAYVAPVLPALSETFVYREVLALRERGVGVVAVTIRRSAEAFEDPRLAALCEEAVPVYSLGWLSLALGAGLEAASHPVRAARTLALLGRDVVRGSDLERLKRAKVAVQGVAGLALAGMLRDRGVRRVHAHFAHVPATIAMYAARQLGVPFSFTGHANDLFRERTLLREKLERADRVVCISRWHRAFYQQNAPLAEARAPVIRCGVSTSEFAPHPGEQDPRVVLGVGRLVEKKGFDVLVRAVARLRDRGVEVRCRVVGDGTCHDALASLIVDLEVADRVELLGSRSNEEVRELMRSSGLFVLPCVEDSRGDRDGIPVVLMEAMATGLCVVSGALPAIAELVENGQTGVMVRPGDVDELADAIETLVREPARAGVLGAAGRRRVIEEFSQRVNIDRLMEAFGLEEAGAARPLPIESGRMADAEHEEPRRKRA